MSFSEERVRDIAGTIGIEPSELAALLAQGGSHVYKSGDYLFHESTPRQWMGIVEEGEVEIAAGVHGAVTRLATLTRGTAFGEGVMLDDLPHSASAIALSEVKVLQVRREVFDELRKTKPEIFYRMVSHVARRLSTRLRDANRQVAGAGPAVAATWRREHDSLGEREISDSAYYGVQTLRGMENFPISGIPLSHFSHFVRSFAYVKKAAASANRELGVLKPERADAIMAACDEMIAGQLHEHFTVDMTNDAYPTAIKVGVILTLRDAISALRELKEALEAKAESFSDVLKMGRTENQDAVPMTLGQEFGAYAVMIGDGMRYLERAGEELHEINMGATAIGTGINSPPGYAQLCTKHLAEISGLPLTLAANLVEATQDSGGFALMSSAMKTAAVQLSKICNDLRWLSSGPRCGLYEIRLPSMQPGSSIMPGKVNPVIPEVVSQVCFQIIGADVTVSMASEASELELNMAEPIIAFNLLFGLTLLRNAAVILNARCISGIEANRERCMDYVRNSIGLVTALNPVLGYERSAAIAKEALVTGGSVYDLVLAKGWLSKERLDELLSPEKMTRPRVV
jgi:aspartate ammonia-lyase